MLYILPRTFPPLKLKHVGIHTHLPAFFDLIGHLSHFDIDERCQTAEPDQPKNVTFKTFCHLKNIQSRA